MWKRAVWKEGDVEEEGTVPSNWIRNDLLLWPPTLNGHKYLKDRKEPTEKWQKFELIKVKVMSGNLIVV